MFLMAQRSQDGTTFIRKISTLEIWHMCSHYFDVCVYVYHVVWGGEYAEMGELV